MSRQKCNICAGTGKCDMCYGTGITRYQGSMDIVYNTQADELRGHGKAGEPKRCPTHCKGTGRCTYCRGTGNRPY